MIYLDSFFRLVLFAMENYTIYFIVGTHLIKLYMRIAHDLRQNQQD